MRLYELFRSIAFVARMVVQDIWQAIWKVSRRSDEIESQMKGKFKVFLAKELFGFEVWFPKQHERQWGMRVRMKGTGDEQQNGAPYCRRSAGNLAAFIPNSDGRRSTPSISYKPIQRFLAGFESWKFTPRVGF